MNRLAYFTIFLNVILAVALGGLAIRTLREDPWSPLDFHNPQVVHPETSDLHPGGWVDTTGEKCNHSKDDVPVTANVYLRNAHTRELIVYRGLTIGVEPPGCRTLNFRNPLPGDLAPAVYILEGYERAFRGETTVQIEVWRTESFEVKGR